MLTIDENGVLRINEPGRHIVLAPGDFEAAEAALTADELAQAQAVWTPAVIDAWQQAHPQPETPPVPLPSVEERQAAVEDGLIEFIDFVLGGM